MKVQELVDKLKLKVLPGEKGLNREINGCHVSDLLSDVIGHADSGNIWITLHTHKNIIAVASLKDLAGIILVKDIFPDEEAISKSITDRTHHKRLSQRQHLFFHHQRQRQGDERRVPCKSLRSLDYN